MQVIDTHVRNSPDGTLTVDFTGDGSELVSVKMSGVDGSLEGDHAVLRAKEVMVQITAFGDPTKNEIIASHFYGAGCCRRSWSCCGSASRRHSGLANARRLAFLIMQRGLK